MLFFSSFLTAVSSALVPLLVLFGGYFFVRLRGGPLLHPVRATRLLLAGDARRSLSALSLALSGTLGVGNITGVILALSVGGAGALFWMWVACLFAMLLRYCEVVAALSLGMPSERLPRPLARLFLLTLSLLLPLLGGLLQSGAAAECLAISLGLPPLAVSLSLALLAAPLLFIGVRIAGITSRLLPCLSLLYLLLTLGVILTYREGFPRVLTSVLRGAFSPRSLAGGIGGVGVIRAMRVGFSRGMLSNEAGLGTAPYAHAEAHGISPVRQGLFGACEVFLDTAVVSSLTAFALLLPAACGQGEGTALSLASLIGGMQAVFGRIAPSLLSVAVLGFAFSTILAFSHYARAALGERGGRYLLAAHLLAVAIGGAIPPSRIAPPIDLLMTILTALNLLALKKAADRIVILSAAEGLTV